MHHSGILLSSVREGDLDYKTVCSELRPVKHNYLKVFGCLGVPHHKLKEFEQREVDPMAASVDYWLRGNAKDAEVSWNSLAEALQIAKERKLADHIRGKFCHIEGQTI